MSREVRLEADLLAKNDELAAKLRARFAEASLPVSNWVSSPGTGKTALLEAVLTRAGQQGLAVAAVVGDVATDNDARRLARSGALVRQITTAGLCHLEADMITAQLREWDLAALDLLVVENVGNLVCPTGFDLGESTRVALLSVTEGEDKPVKYPGLFHSADVVVVTKTDLAEVVGFDPGALRQSVRAVNPDVPLIWTSARTGDGVDGLLDFLLAAPAASPDTDQEAP